MNKKYVVRLTDADLQRPPTKLLVSCIDRTRNVSNQDRRSMGRCPFRRQWIFGWHSVCRFPHTKYADYFVSVCADHGITAFALRSMEKIGQVDLQPLRR